MNRNDERYPHTYAYDLIRSMSPNMSRSDAASAIKGFCDEHGISRLQFSALLADAYILKNTSFLDIICGEEK